MADEKKKLSTQDILAMARAQSSGGSEQKKETPPQAEEQPAGDSGPAAPPPASSDAPKSTADILAAARAQKKQAPSPPASGSGAAPKSTADILAAARAQSGAKPGAGPDESKPAAKTKPAATPVSKGDLPPVEEMVKAFTGSVTPQPPKKPKTPVIPVRPAKPAAKTEEPRRNFLFSLVSTPFALAWTLMVLMGGGITLATARFMMPNVLVEPPSKFKIGPPSDYGFGTVATKWKSQFGVWIVHTEYQGQKEIYALASVCTHLGCTPNWLEGEQKFKCPCHGSGFYINGINFEGPAPRPLERVGISLGADGMLEVDKGVKFQEELGQWSDTSSYVIV